MTASLPYFPQPPEGPPKGSPKGPYVVLDDQGDHSVRYYTEPVDIITARMPAEIEDAFAALSDYHDKGYFLAGYCAYEMGYALEPKLAPLMPDLHGAPLLCFGVFKKPHTDMPLSMRYSAGAPLDLDFHPDWDAAAYQRRFQTVIDYIKAGDVYQINLTFPLRAAYAGSAATLYAAIRQRQGGRYGGIVSLETGDGGGGSDDRHYARNPGRREIISFSPELFFKKTGATMTMRPMKGTRPRSDDPNTDSAQRDAMRLDQKSQAENLMIVDLLRNDLSRLSEPGSVRVPELFSLETYPTLHQMTSQVEATLKPDTTFRDIFKSLFPCGSVTGAPKIRAMEIIKDLEADARGAYCGAMGYIDPNGQACFNVGIRTLTLNAGQLCYPVGSGVVLDSDAQDEYSECLLKADILKPQAPALIETFLWDSGYKRLGAHLARLGKSSRELGYACCLDDIKHALSAREAKLSGAQRVRIALHATGDFNITVRALIALDGPIQIAVSRFPLTPTYQVTDHKVARRDFYDGERTRVASLCGAQEVVFLNPQGQLCEGSFTTLFVEKDGQYLTPALSCGLLPGILRADMLASGHAVEAILTLDDLVAADAVYVGNSLRGLMRAQRISADLI